MAAAGFFLRPDEADEEDHKGDRDDAGSGVPADNFSARWTRRVPFEDGLYRFSARADDGIRVWIDGETLIDQWNGDTSKTYTADLPLAKGKA